VFYSATLGSGDWSTLASGITGSDGLKTLLDTDPGRLAEDQGFYKVVVE
jgi:hypothetical protein